MDYSGLCIEDLCVSEVVAATVWCYTNPACRATAAYLICRVAGGCEVPDNILQNEDGSEDKKPDCPPLPDDYVGIQDDNSGDQGNRHKSGPLSPEHGGNGNAKDDFNNLTGNTGMPVPDDSTYPPGTLIGDNGITLRPETNGSGPRIDIPSNGSRPHETLHY